MILDFLYFLRGYLVIKVSGSFIERFINIATKNGILLRKITRGKDSATMLISARGFKKIRSAARKTKTSVKIVEKCGLPLFLHKHRKRSFFYVGICIFGAVLLCLSSFIWSVEIEGTEKIDKNIIREALRSCGIDAGVVKYNHKLSDIQDDMLLKVPSLSWCWVEIRGTRAIVSVRERSEKPEIEQSDIPCNIVAKRDGVIKKLTVLQGEPVLKEGEAVQKGGLIVSGALDSSFYGVRLIHADAEVEAETWHEKSGVFPLVRTETKETGRAEKRYVLSMCGKDITVYPFSKICFSDYEIAEEEKKLKLWGDFYLPISVKIQNVRETESVEIPQSNEEAADFYAAVLYADLEKEAEDAEIIEKNSEYTVENGTITLKCTLHCSENIAERRTIETGG